MRRAAPTLPVTPAMLRHFAAVTLVATVCLAVFANGENTSAQAETKPAAEAGSEGGGVMSAMFGGSEEAALKKSREGDGKRSVNGMQVGSGTRLEQNGGNDYDHEDYRGNQVVQGDIRNLDPEYQTMKVTSPGLGADATPQLAAAPAPISRDPSGIPIPSVRTGQPGNGRAGPPRLAGEQDIKRMMDASLQRSSVGTGTAGVNHTSDDQGAED